MRRSQVDLTDAPHIITCVLAPPDRNAPPIVRPKTSRAIARNKAKAEDAARIAADAERLGRMVIPSLKPPAERLWSINGAALLLLGPKGGIPIAAGAVSILHPLVGGGRHALQERAGIALSGLAPRLAAVGLRIDRRAAGVRITRVRSKASHAGSTRQQPR